MRVCVCVSLCVSLRVCVCAFRGPPIWWFFFWSSFKSTPKRVPQQKQADPCAVSEACFGLEPIYEPHAAPQIRAADLTAPVDKSMPKVSAARRVNTPRRE